MISMVRNLGFNSGSAVPLVTRIILHPCLQYGLWPSFGMTVDFDPFWVILAGYPNDRKVELIYYLQTFS
jgi:hypothetical protein